MDKQISAEPCVYFEKVVGKDIKSAELTIAWSFLIITRDQVENYVSAYLRYWRAVDHTLHPIEVAARRVE